VRVWSRQIKEGAEAHRVVRKARRLHERERHGDGLASARPAQHMGKVAKRLERADGTARVEGAAMVRSLRRLLATLLVSVFLLALLRSSPARAAPLDDVEDALVDGEIDPEDLVAHGTMGRAVPRTPPGGHAWVSLVGISRESVVGKREVGGFVVVGLPLERFGREGKRGPAPARPPLLVPVRGPSVLASRVRAGSEAIVLSPQLGREAVVAAWRAAGLGSNDRSLDAIVSRARWSAVLPETRLRAMRFDDAKLSTDVTTTTDTSRLRDTVGANTGYEARLTWRLDRLLYSNDERFFQRMKLDRMTARARVAGRVLDALFHWQRATIELRWAQKESRDEVDAALRAAQAETTLDVLTGGWFSASRPARDLRVLVPLSPPLPDDHASPELAPREDL
jgi:hypothetical protein